MKTKINFIIDAIMFLLMALLTGLGLLIKYVLLSGKESWIKYGKKVEITFWGLDKHEWGNIHLWIAIVLIIFFALHIILHWKIVVILYKKIIKNRRVRIILGALLLIISILLIIFPFIFQVSVDEKSKGREVSYKNISK